MSLISIIILIGIVQGIFIGTLLVTRKNGNRHADKIFGILFFNFSINMLYYFFHSIDLFSKYPHLLKTTFPISFLYGPLLYFYAKMQTDSSFRINRKQLLHFIPFILTIISNIPFYVQSAQFKLDFYHQEGIIKNWLEAVQSITLIIQLSIYLVINRRIINNHIQKMKYSVSFIDKVNLRWLSINFNYFIALFVLIAVQLLLIYVGVDLTPIYHISIPVLMTIFIFVLGYNGLKQPEIIIQKEEENNGRKYENSALTNEKSETYLEQLLDLMQHRKPYLESDLTLLKLSQQIGISTHNLSQVINEKLDMNFYDFVNKHRVEEAKRLLIDPAKQPLTILAIAEEAGFNSKTTFNSCFKKFTSTTPSEYKRHNLPRLTD